MTQGTRNMEGASDAGVQLPKKFSSLAVPN